ncbi:CDP-alcohol phosphatidyltransferase family protein [Alphaproteobacteria bacterium]|nr:CDP-alcohol phosphatidyltransferase family protein [Alphaproteobacteria bacterium]
MTMKYVSNKELPSRSMMSFFLDVPNLCSLAGLACSLGAIYFSLTGVYAAAMIGMIWAVAFDWADGLIARKMKLRTGVDKQFGGQLDLLIDIVSYGIAPGILILSYGNYNIIYLGVVFVMLTFGVIRLSYFSTFGISSDGNYTGLAIDNNSIIIVFVFMFYNQFEQINFSIFLGCVGLFLAILNVSPIKTPKLSGKPANVVALAAYTLGVTIFYSRHLLS